MSYLQPARFENGTYQNPVFTEVGVRGKVATMLWRLIFGKEERVPRHPLGPFQTDPTVFATPPASGLRITLLGHSSLLVEIDGTTILVDPVYALRASFVQWFGPKRFFAPPLPMANLPRLDAVLLTHDHYDHLDSAAVQQLQERTPLFICSMGVGDHLRRWGVAPAKIRELNWMDSFVVPSPTATPLTVKALPARHFSGRGLKRFQSLWSSFQFKTDRHNVYHGADSGYFGGYAEIGEKLGPFDLVMLEIGAFDPMWQQIHLGPQNALRAALDLRAKAALPIHWGMFNLAFHDWYQPPEYFTALAAGAGMPVWLPEPGQPAEFTGEAANSLWWRRYMAARPHSTEAATSTTNKVLDGSASLVR